MTTVTCHPERKHRAHGLCNTCYHREYFRKNPGKRPKQRPTYLAEWRAKKLATDPDYFNRQSREKHRKNPERHYAAKLKHKYKITLADYDAMLASQGGRCAICGGRNEKRKQRLYVDHDHQTKRVRGLLCDDCNIGLGRFADSPQRLAAARAYLLQSWEQVA